METFRYSLDKSSKKFFCPQCNKKRFVLYVDAESNSYLHETFGKCDREQNCSYHKAPLKGKKCYLITFLKILKISDKAFRLTDLNGRVIFIPKSQILEQEEKRLWITEWFLKTSTLDYIGLEFKYFYCDASVINERIDESLLLELDKPSFHSLDLLNEMYNRNYEDNLTKFLKEKFSKEKVFKAMQNYFITGTDLFWNNSTAFWQIDEKERIHGCKIMKYDKCTGKRVKEPYNHINWLHKKYSDPEFKLVQCLFGLHLIKENYNKTVAVVESEKSAIIMSMILPEFIWLATGSRQNLKIDLLKPLKNKNIVLYPDKGEYEFWREKARVFISEGFKVAVSDLIEKTDLEKGHDIADLLIVSYL